MTRDEILAAARQCVSVDRAATYGHAEDVFIDVAAIWHGYSENDEDAIDALVKMALMKIVRTKRNRTHADSWVDAIGYLALAGELATEAK